MPDEKGKLYLYEALELRSEYDARIKTLKECLPEIIKNRSRLSFTREDEGILRPCPDFDAEDTRNKLKKLDYKRRMLNSAIQQTNFTHSIDFNGNTINLNEALEVRKGLNERIGELHTQVVSSAYQRVIYKEGRDIVEANDLDYLECTRRLEEARLEFRELNRKIREASFKFLVEFLDEK